MSPFILTSSHQPFRPLDPRPGDIDVYDLARALAYRCRFGGWVMSGRFYSVAQHSVLVSREVPKALQKAALLHDAAEPYSGIGDVAGPIKCLLWERHEGLRELERRVELAVAERFGVNSLDFDAPEVKTADRRMCVTEMRDVCGHRRSQLGAQSKIEPYRWSIEAVGPDEAEGMFLARFTELFGSTRPWTLEE